MSQEPVDLEEIVKAWASEVPLVTIRRSDIDDVQPEDIDWTDVRIRHGPTEYSDQTQDPIPKKHVLFTSYFTNKTDRPQTFKLISERRTQSVTSISMAKTFTIGYHANIKVSPPNPVVEANAGFKGEMSVTDSNQETFVEEMIWSVNNDICVPPNHQTKAELSLNEVEYLSQFKCETTFEGIVNVKLRHKKNSCRYEAMTGRVKDIFRNEHGFRVDGSTVYFLSKGECKSRFGIEQNVKLSETEITENKDCA